MGQKNLPPKKREKKKKTTLPFIHHSGLSLHQAIPMRAEGNPPQERRDPLISLLLKGKNSPARPSVARNFATAAGSRLDRLPARSTGAAKSGPSHIPSPAMELTSSSIY